MTAIRDPELQRKFPRYVFQRTNWLFALKLRDRDLVLSPIQLEAVNISVGGILFQSNKKIDIFEIVQLQLLDKNSKELPINLEGRIVRVSEIDTGLQEKTFGMAVEFFENHDSEKRMHKTLERLTPIRVDESDL